MRHAVLRSLEFEQVDYINHVQSARKYLPWGSPESRAKGTLARFNTRIKFTALQAVVWRGGEGRAGEGRRAEGRGGGITQLSYEGFL